jgi:hypothetical protein
MKIPGDLSVWYNITIKQFEKYTRGINAK